MAAFLFYFMLTNNFSVTIKNEPFFLPAKTSFIFVREYGEVDVTPPDVDNV